tara:strand:- start:1379 stop:2374 length:996 start_codon:yes stop_codon:yes gene_type:complete
MPLPGTKQELADWILRRLGAPVINIEIADVQLEDCIDEAVQFFYNYHYDGSIRSYRTIKIDTNLLNRNKRIHQNLTAEFFDSDSNSYRVGDRVMKKASNTRGYRIFIKKDSETADSDNNKFSNLWEEELKLLEDENITVTDAGQIGIKVPDDIISVTKVSKVDSFTHAGMYNFEYQYFLNNFDMFYGTAAGTGLSNYYTQKLNVEHIDFLLNTMPAIRFNQYKSRLYLDVDWDRIEKGKGRGDFFLLCEVYEQADPESNGEVYKNTWLKRYATALSKLQWGSNLKKYQNTELPGGVQLDGQGLWDEANAEKQELEEELKNATLETDSILWG